MIPSDQRFILGRSNAIERAVDREFSQNWSLMWRWVKSGKRSDWGSVYTHSLAFISAMFDAKKLLQQLLKEFASATHAKTVRQVRLFESTAFEADEIDPLEFIFRPLSLDLVERIVYGSDWISRFDQLTKLSPPEAIAGLIANAIAAGRRPQEVAREILPMVQGVRSSATRIARTEGMRVAHEVQIQTWEQIPDLIIAYQIHATLDQNTRPEHRARDGTIYYRNPRPGQLGFDAMPRPPIEANGKVAHNCRCFLTPLFDTAAVADLRPKS